MKPGQRQKRLRLSESHRKCPICQSSGRRLIFKQYFMGSALLTGYHVVTCNHCGAAYADLIPQQSDFNRYYRQFSKYEYSHHNGQVSASDMRTFERLANFICKSDIDRNGAILDVGCATGAFLHVLGRHGFKNLHGLDPSPACAKVAARLYQIPVATGTVFDLGCQSGQFDLIILAGVLEHIRDVRRALQNIVNRLTPGGRLFLAVPDAMGLAASRNAPFQQFSTEHINFFTASSLRNLMAVVGFEQLAHLRFMRKQGIKTTEPIVCGLYRQAGGGVKVSRDQHCQHALQRYVAASRVADRRVCRIIDQAARRGKKLIIWGVGSLTHRLLAAGLLRVDQIAAFVDSSERIRSRRIAGRRILAPTELHGRSEPILISSWMYQEEIFKQIKQQMRLSNTVIKLHQRGMGT